MGNGQLSEEVTYIGWNNHFVHASYNAIEFAYIVRSSGSNISIEGK
jgi:hypothetical protein